jgi:SsrA-binding protein
MAAKPRKPNASPRILNRRAQHDYHLGEKLECGIVLHGTEVKAIRDGRVDLAHAFARVELSTMELWLHEMDVGACAHASADRQHLAKSKRKLLARKEQIQRLYGKLTDKGASLIPTSLYFNDHGYAKIELAVATGKRKSDKREAIKKKDDRRMIQQAMSKRKNG